MSAEAQFRGLLAGHAPLVAMVDDRIALNAVPEGGGYPCIAYSVALTTEACLDPADDETHATITVQCWAGSPTEARALADEVRAAVEAAPAAHCAWVMSEGTVFAEELGLDGVQLDVDWWP